MKSAYETGSDPRDGARESDPAPRSRRNGEARKLAGAGKRLRDHGKTRHRAELTPAMKRGLRILYLEGQAIQETKFWRTRRTSAIPLETVIALYDRYLVMIVYESRHRKRQIAELTEIGRLVAERLTLDEDRLSGPTISPAAMLLAASLIDD